MKHIRLAAVLMLMLTACGTPAEEIGPPDTGTIPLTLPETSAVDEGIPETEETEKSEQDYDYVTLAEECAEKAVQLLKERQYLLAGESVSSVVRYGEVKSLYAFEEKLKDEFDDGDELILVEVSTDQGTVPLVYNLGKMLVTETPEGVERPVPELDIPDTSLPAELDGAAPVTVHGIRKYFVGYDKRLQKNSMLFRITAPEELEQIRDGLDYFWEFDQEEMDFARYDDAWFETHDLYIADMGAGGSYPDLAVMEVTDGNRLLLGYENGGGPVTDDIVGRLVFVEVNKGDILTWPSADDRYYTADAFAQQVNAWIMDDCWQSARSRISREDTFVTDLPEITYPTLAEIPDHLRGDDLEADMERYRLTEESVLIRMDISAADGKFAALFTESGEWLEFTRID